MFAGGGNRCLWQAGLWSVAAPALGLAPRTVAAVSAGATIASLLFSGRADAALEAFYRATAENPRNVYPLAPLRGRPAFPHLAMYRAAILGAIDDAALRRLHEGPDLRVLLARPPAWMGPRLGVALGFGAYEAEKAMSGPVHPTAGRRLGFVPEVVSARSCATPEALADLLIASSCTPPFTPVVVRDGRPALDGGLVDNVPVDALGPDPGPTVVLLTRGYPAEKIPAVPGRVYLQSSEPIPVSKWDYTSPHLLRATFDLGRRDGERLARAPWRLSPEGVLAAAGAPRRAATSAGLRSSP